MGNSKSTAKASDTQCNIATSTTYKDVKTPGGYVTRVSTTSG